MLLRRLTDLSIQIYADGADQANMLALYRNPLIRGFTTNPTLMRKAGVSDYETFARAVLQAIPDRPISFEVFSDDFAEMETQAEQIASWGANVYVKIPVTNTHGDTAMPLARRLALRGIPLNITAVFTLAQVAEICDRVGGLAPAIVSVFAGRIADTGVDPVPLMAAAAELVHRHDNLELLWASPRELLNLFQADAVGCDIITATSDVLAKLTLIGKDLRAFSLETVRMFRNDAVQAGFYLTDRRSAAA